MYACIINDYMQNDSHKDIEICENGELFLGPSQTLQTAKLYLML